MREVDNRNKDEIIAYQEIRIEALEKRVKDLEEINNIFAQELMAINIIKEVNA